MEDALYVQSGFCANQAAIPPLVGREDVIFSDRLNHASIIDGCRLSGAKIVVYEHCDPADLEAKVREHLLGEAKLAQAFSRRLFEENVFAVAIGFPTVPQGKAHIRVMLSAALSRDDLDYGLERFAKIGKEFETR